MFVVVLVIKITIFNSVAEKIMDRVEKLQNDRGILRCENWLVKKEKQELKEELIQEKLKNDFLTQNLNFFGKLLYRAKKGEMKAKAENIILRRELLRMKRQLVAEQNKVSALVQLGNQVLQEVSQFCYDMENEQLILLFYSSF